jgi:site-specific DNA-methyltransferase (adenine-specific)
MSSAIYQPAAFTLHLGDCIEVMRAMPDNSVDAVVTDPPYELGFMGKSWDASGIANNADMWREALRVLKPGGHLLAFSGARTYHRMAVAIEDAGFEIRDQIMWVYGSGFPKSMNVAKAIESGGGRPEDIRRMQMGGEYEPSGRGRVNYDHGGASAMNGASGPWRPTTDAALQWEGWGTALKPAHEPICVARKPLAKGLTVAANVLQFGTGAINIDGCRVELNGDYKCKANGRPSQTGLGDNYDPTKANQPDTVGRWPANLIHDRSAEVVALFPDAKGQQGRSADANRSQVNVFGAPSDNGKIYEPRGDFGSAARFFYCAKASRADRNEGLPSAGAPAVTKDATMHECETADWSTRNGNHHPTVKATDLMAYLVRLVTPSGGLVLDPFMGSGSTGKACMREGFHFIGIDMTREYVEIARARIEHEQQAVAAAGEQAAIPQPQLSLFGEVA